MNVQIYFCWNTPKFRANLHETVLKHCNNGNRQMLVDFTFWICLQKYGLVSAPSLNICQKWYWEGPCANPATDGTYKAISLYVSARIICVKSLHEYLFSKKNTIFDIILFVKPF